ncbi:MAG: acetolactate decarboxylase [Hydrogenophaga sp.]|jgi:alpha-acetolactate decarboxylase|uniref:acetolactate decarboxylase n=2 Tax=Hydrogenophaga sp. TaxID=1904254 RepID=UPI002737276D|nr:acetolactate decarboxylase [Hydrogenophaga sp.]MDP1781979.1 acetolactate decarboxylase [Hydrogenophaga sp.]MDP3347609.1 acetolactate decarboxylase [Hydrogenophaga sp.]
MNALKHRSKALLAVGLLAVGIALAASLPFAFHHVGNFKRMSHTGDTAGQAAVSSLPQAAGTWGVGATAGLKAEMIQIDGRLLVSPGSDDRGRVRPPEANEQALLWASARVAAWAEVPVPRDMEQPAFEAFVQEQARARGLSLDQPFPFRVTGAFPSLRWHVVTGEKPAGRSSSGHGAHGAAHAGHHANQQAGMKVFHEPGAVGQLVGVYSGTALEGVVSHPGERFHAHYVDDQLSVSGHVDAYAVAQGAVLLLPLR